MDYLPHSPGDRSKMLKSLGLESVDSLFEDIPQSVLLKKPLTLPDPLSEHNLRRHVTGLAKQDKTGLLSFLGAGCYDHFIPAAVDHMLLRSEFYTAYTPYQAEVSQGTLQALYEYQSMICGLTGMQVSNASMYDGSTATAEAAFMACRTTGREKILASTGMHPQYRTVLSSYADSGGLDVDEVELDMGVTSMRDLKKRLGDDTACVIVQYPNFLGCIEDIEELAETVKSTGALFIVSINEPTSLGLLKPPIMADIVAGDGQALGNTMSFGGPGFGFFATSKDYVRRMPGRIVGATVDTEGRRGFVLTLQAREQHIRREKATSNICTSQALNAIAASIHLALLGKTGFQDVARASHSNAVYAQEQILNINGFSAVYGQPFYNEFPVKAPKGTLGKLLESDILGGYDVSQDYPGLKDCILVSTTECHTRQDIDTLVKTLKEVDG